MDEINVLSHRASSGLLRSICLDIWPAVMTRTPELPYMNRKVIHYAATSGVELSSRCPRTIKLWNLLVCYKQGQKISDTGFLDFVHLSVF
jgi:hypothetical protein